LSASADPGVQAEAARPPLDGLRVVDLCDLRGALAGRLLADLGADVVLVEPTGGSPDRLRAPFVGREAGPDRSLAFLYRNAGKRGASLDPSTESGRCALDRLLAGADVLVENLSAAERAAAGLDPGALRLRHPHLVHAAIADFGLDGPLRDWRLEALPAFAASGALHACGFPDRAPCWIPGHLAHDAAATTAVAGVLAALLGRDRDGRGRAVEVSVQEAALCGLHPWSVPVADYARLYPLLPVDLPRDADGAYLVLPVADGHVRVLPGTPEQFAGFLRLLRGPVEDATTASPAEGFVARARRSVDAAVTAVGTSVVAATPAPVARRLAGLPAETAKAAASALAAISRLVPIPSASTLAMQAGLAIGRRFASDALRSRGRGEVLRSASRLRVPLAPVQSPDEYRASEQASARRAFVATGFPAIGDAPFARTPLRMDGVLPAPSKPAPAPPSPRDSTVDATWSPRPPHATDPGAVAAATPTDHPDPGPGRPSGSGGATAAQRQSLAGIRAIDLGVGAAVPEIGWLLAELGAEVIRIESPSHLDFLRRITVEPDTPNRSWMFNDANRGQRSVCLDLSTPRGRALALDLCATADVVIENHRGGVASDLGLDEPAVRARRHDVIWLSSQGYGRGGPLDRAPSFGPLVSAFAGVTWLQNHPDAPWPAGSSLNHPDHLASKLGLAAVLAALRRRARDGMGSSIEMAQTEVAAWLQGEVYLEGPLTGRGARPSGNAAPFACPHGVYPCAGRDRWCAIAVVDDRSWEALRRLLAWPLDPDLERLEGRLARREEIDRRLSGWTRTRSPWQAACDLQAAGISAMPVLSTLELRADRHLGARGAFVAIDDPEVGRALHCANPIRDGIRRPPAGPAPRLGADTEAVLREILGIAGADIATLRRDGVCS
jgi:benzylsuccinate CoA-transferase BbsF subunit